MIENRLKRPSWMKNKALKKGSVNFVKDLSEGENIYTVCNSAKCPNRGECFSNKTLTFMILGGTCTRSCNFCAVDTGKPDDINPKEIPIILNIIKKLDLKYVVITSVTRDDLEDGGSGHFANLVNSIHEKYPEIKVEVLTPDFKGNIQHLKIVLDSRPFVFNHNVETVPRLYKTVRPQANYERSLKVLKDAKDMYPESYVKSGIMLGLGETDDEIVAVMKDIHNTGCDFLTVGHYIRPSAKHHPVIKYYEIEDFIKFGDIAHDIGFKRVMSMPFARSSYLANTYAN